MAVELICLLVEIWLQSFKR